MLVLSSIGLNILILYFLDSGTPVLYKGMSFRQKKQKADLQTSQGALPRNDICRASLDHKCREQIQYGTPVRPSSLPKI